MYLPIFAIGKIFLVSNLDLPSSSLNSLLLPPVEMEISGSLPSYRAPWISPQSLTQVPVAIRRAPSTGKIPLTTSSLIYSSQMQNLFQQKAPIWTNK